MENNTDITPRQTNISPVVWFLGIGLVAGLIAVFVFNIAVGTVAYYGLFAFMMGSHFFMHGSHGGHGGHQHNPEQSNNDEHSKHAGGCH